MELQVHGYELTLRLAEAEQIEVEEISERTDSHFRGERLKPVDHPGLGEEGDYGRGKTGMGLLSICLSSMCLV